jgi:hypothetical protein
VDITSGFELSGEAFAGSRVLARDAPTVVA